MSNLFLARFQMGFTLAWHMLFVAFGVGMPLLMIIAEGLWLKTHEDRYLKLARNWAKVASILFAIGAVSGTAISFQLGLLWPGFMQFAGSTIGPAFAIEGFAFFTEAIFLGLYLYGWDRLSPRVHWFTGLMTALGSAASAILVVAANAWMQNPLGAELIKSNPSAINLSRVLFLNSHWFVMLVHSTISTYAASSFAVAGIYAWGALRGKKDAYQQAAIKIALVVGLISSIIMPLSGHISGQMMATDQPEKLAAIEGLFKTQAQAPLKLGGIVDLKHQELKYAIPLPGGLSILAFNNPNAVVKGLDTVPQSDWPDIPLVHYAFDIMIGAGVVMLLIAIAYWWLRRKRGEVGVLSPGLLKWLVVGTPLGLIALECGWIVTEVGRQPWIIWHVMRTGEAVTTAPGLPLSVSGFVLLYAILTVSLLWLLKRLKAVR